MSAPTYPLLPLPHVASSRHGASAVTFVSGESHSHRSGKRKEHTSELWESVAICYSQEPTVVPSNTWRRHYFCVWKSNTFYFFCKVLITFETFESTKTFLTILLTNTQLEVIHSILNNSVGTRYEY